MRLYKFFALSILLFSAGLAACGSKTDTRPDIFNHIAQADLFTQSAAKIECEVSADYPAAQYHRLCYQIDAVTIPSQNKAGEAGLNLGLKIQDVFKDTGWEPYTEDPSRFHYLKRRDNGCTDKLFFVFSGFESLTSRDGDYPVEFAPRLSFSKMRKSPCAESGLEPQ